MFASVVAVVRCATIGFLQWQFQQLIQIFLFVCVILLTTADAATIVRSFPGNAPWLAYESGSQVNKLLESCIPRPDPGCTTGSNNGLGCKWNVLKSEDLGFGLFGVLRFRNMTSYNFYSPGGTGKWIDRIDNFDLPCLHSRDPSHAEFEFVNASNEQRHSSRWDCRANSNSPVGGGSNVDTHLWQCRLDLDHDPIGGWLISRARFLRRPSACFQWRWG